MLYLLLSRRSFRNSFCLKSVPLPLPGLLHPSPDLHDRTAMTPTYAKTHHPHPPLPHNLTDNDDEGFLVRVIVPGGHVPSGGRRVFGRGCPVDGGPASVQGGEHIGIAKGVVLPGKSRFFLCACFLGGWRCLCLCVWVVLLGNVISRSFHCLFLTSYPSLPLSLPPIRQNQQYAPEEDGFHAIACLHLFIISEFYALSRFHLSSPPSLLSVKINSTPPASRTPAITSPPTSRPPWTRKTGLLLLLRMKSKHKPRIRPCGRILNDSRTSSSGNEGGREGGREVDGRERVISFFHTIIIRLYAFPSLCTLCLIYAFTHTRLPPLNPSTPPSPPVPLLPTETPQRPLQPHEDLLPIPK
jgi:hypothetical protein